jgi:hypothetical protein
MTKVLTLILTFPNRRRGQASHTCVGSVQQAATAAGCVANAAARSVALFARWNTQHATTPFNLCVMGMDGTEVVVEVCQLNSILEVKMAVALKAGIPEGQQQLFWEAEGGMVTNKRWVAEFLPIGFTFSGEGKYAQFDNAAPLFQMVVVQSAIQEVSANLFCGHVRFNY